MKKRLMDCDTKMVLSGIVSEIKLASLSHRSSSFVLAEKTPSWMDIIKKLFIAVSIIKYFKNPNYLKAFETSVQCFLKSV